MGSSVVASNAKNIPTRQVPANTQAAPALVAHAFHPPQHAITSVSLPPAGQTQPLVADSALPTAAKGKAVDAQPTEVSKRDFAALLEKGKASARGLSRKLSNLGDTERKEKKRRGTLHGLFTPKTSSSQAESSGSAAKPAKLSEPSEPSGTQAEAVPDLQPTVGSPSESSFQPAVSLATIPFKPHDTTLSWARANRQRNFLVIPSYINSHDYLTSHI